MHGNNDRTTVYRQLHDADDETDEILSSLYLYKHVKPCFFENAVTKGELVVGNQSYYRRLELGNSADPFEGSYEMMIPDEELRKNSSHKPVRDYKEAMFCNPDIKISAFQNRVTYRQVNEPCLIMSLTMRPNPDTQRKFGKPIMILNPRSFKEKIDDYLSKEFEIPPGTMRGVTYYDRTDVASFREYNTHPAHMKPKQHEGNVYENENELRLAWKMPRGGVPKALSQFHVLPIPSLVEHMLPLPDNPIEFKKLPFSTFHAELGELQGQLVERLQYLYHEESFTKEYIDNCITRYRLSK